MQADAMPHKVLSNPSGATAVQQKPAHLKNGVYMEGEFEDQVEECINLMYRNTLGIDNLLELLSVIYSLLNNIINKPHETKYRTVKLSNAKIAATIGRSRDAIQLFKILCFLENVEGNLEFIGKDELDLAELKVASNMVHEFAMKIEGHRNNIGVASIGSTTGQTNADVAHRHGDSSSSAIDLLVQVKASRAVYLSH